MIQVQWNRKFEVGHERIDFEHKIFLGLIRDVSLAPQQGIQKERILRHLNEVKKYAVFHFTSEENIMFDVTYPDRERHIKEHEILLALLTDKTHQYRSEEIELDDIVSYLFEWFALHTTQIDTKLSHYISDV
ncbi:MAG: hemerythrin domain-containing protein [Candidatus Thiodiazotropha sp.]|nr:hemerythrin domain-containing protein [Candidatus Thiodiazotropha sp.]MCU7864934.1 hemerythrin domain-containing protein [Candidatus Thiodiazotropha sp. (ex Lucinoma borealis)]MCU7882963.1 hemerythrin domain-containing protein [Candidatus Thiodiazotropha sp. (ex Lucinoma annulata)]MCM8885097.1 hemerythrin domain-containing protein [Candidatus Thiodiazotropha sp.]MCM8921515.1 hemerythrin domain-containing protein [Candidatus Thiodiazotropha sp.]